LGKAGFYRWIEQNSENANLFKDIIIQNVASFPKDLQGKLILSERFKIFPWSVTD
jgi:hypothetical protein